MTHASNGSPAPDAAWAVFVDFDGTITDLDTFDVLVRHYAGADVWARTQTGLEDGSVTLRDVLQDQASHVRAPFADVAALLRREIAVDPAFAHFVAACRARDIPVTVLSSGIAPIVAGRLAEIGCGDLPIVANDVDALPTGWRIRFRDAVANGTDKAAFVLAARRAGARTIFIGDGHSDFAAARAADRCFAKRGLALEAYLAANGIAHDTFSTFAQIEAALSPSVLSRST
ncbi:MAG: MtnX-like HAD-IB family phosphatase [Vulcanimicrobiaceae bacterium]